MLACCHGKGRIVCELIEKHGMNQHCLSVVRLTCSACVHVNVHIANVCDAYKNVHMMCVCLCVHVPVRVPVRVSMCVCMCTCVRMSMDGCVCMCVHMYVCVCTYV